jgi:hypothetical protein
MSFESRATDKIEAIGGQSGIDQSELGIRVDVHPWDLALQPAHVRQHIGFNGGVDLERSHHRASCTLMRLPFRRMTEESASC